VEVVSRRPADLIADLEGPQEVWAAHVQVAVLEPEGLVDLRFVVELERQRAGLVEDLHLGDLHLDRAGGELRILGSRRSRRDGPAHGQHEFRAHRLRPGVRVATRRRVEHALGQPFPITQVDEDQAPVIPPAIGPAHERHHLPHV